MCVCVCGVCAWVCVCVCVWVGGWVGVCVCVCVCLCASQQHDDADSPWLFPSPRRRGCYRPLASSRTARRPLGGSDVEVYAALSLAPEHWNCMVLSEAMLLSYLLPARLFERSHLCPATGQEQTLLVAYACSHSPIPQGAGRVWW